MIGGDLSGRVPVRGSGDDFDHLRDGQVVEFDEEPDRANGTHAYNVIPVELPANAKA